MKKVLFVLCFCLITTLGQAKEFSAEKFEMRFIITFNSLTLDKAAEKEILIKEKFKDACRIEVKVDKAGPTSVGEITINADQEYFLDDITGIEIIDD